MGWEGKSAENRLPYWLRSQGDFREALQHMFYRPAAIQSYRHGHKGGNYTDMLPLWLANHRIKVIHKGSKRVWLSDPFLPLSGKSLSIDVFWWAICNHACPCDVSCDCLLTCNCVKRAALSICSARPHQCLMQSLSLFHFAPSLSLYLWKQPTIWYWSTTCC